MGYEIHTYRYKYIKCRTSDVCKPRFFGCESRKLFHFFVRHCTCCCHWRPPLEMVKTVPNHETISTRCFGHFFQPTASFRHTQQQQQQQQQQPQQQMLNKCTNHKM